jgi:hypothetical protein
MSNESGLAAVHEAAGSITRADHDRAIGVARQEGDQSGYTRGHTEGLAAGAAAERARLIGIEAHALPGHEALIAACKADATCTPDQAAGRILAAERKIRDDQMKGIAGVEQHTGKIAAAVTTVATSATGAAVPQTAEGWKAEWARIPDLQADFRSADAYAAYAQGVADGRIRVLKAPLAK